MDEKHTTDLEDRRQLEHLLPIVFAFLLPYISYGIALSLAGLAVIHALYISPKLVRVTTRQDEKTLGFSVGKLLYALCVLALLLVFHDRIYIAAGVWALLAVGDSFSNVIGRRWGEMKLPYNPEKSLAGLLAFWVTGAASAWALIVWNLPAETVYSYGLLLCICLITALVAAIAESLPPAIDDNLIISWVGALSFVLLFSIDSSVPHFSGSWIQAISINLAAAVLATKLRWISGEGTMLALVFGFFVYVTLDWPAYLLLCTFLVLGSLATRLGKRRKERLKVAEKGGGRRGASNVLSNGIVPILIATSALWVKNPALHVAFAAAVATAALDTVATEIGQWLGQRPIDPLTLRRVRIGTPGAISWVGTGAGLLAATTLALISASTEWLPFSAVPVIVLAALSGGMAESLVSSMLKRKLRNTSSALNIYNTLIGACIGGILWLNV